MCLTNWYKISILIKLIIKNNHYLFIFYDKLIFNYNLNKKIIIIIKKKQEYLK